MPAPIPVLLMVRELNLGGSERQMAEIAKALDRSRFDPRVGCFRPAGLRADDLRAAGVPIVHFPVPSIASVKGALRIAAYVREQNIQLVHTFDTPANLYGAPAARLAGSAVVVSSQRVDRALWQAWQRHGLRITDRLVDGIVVNCDFLRRHLRDEEKVPAGLIHLCYNGIDTRAFQPRKTVRPEALRSASLVLGVVCGLRPEKGLDTLLDAFPAVRGLVPGMKLAIVGSGPCLPDLQDRARALGVLPDCVFEPATPHVADWKRSPTRSWRPWLAAAAWLLRAWAAIRNWSPMAKLECCSNRAMPRDWPTSCAYSCAIPHVAMSWLQTPPA
jgi:L-malate glycosyltransferase